MYPATPSKCIAATIAIAANAGAPLSLMRDSASPDLRTPYTYRHWPQRRAESDRPWAEARHRWRHVTWTYRTVPRQRQGEMSLSSGGTSEEEAGDERETGVPSPRQMRQMGGPSSWSSSSSSSSPSLPPPSFDISSSSSISAPPPNSLADDATGDSGRAGRPMPSPTVLLLRSIAAARSSAAVAPTPTVPLPPLAAGRGGGEGRWAEEAATFAEEDATSCATRQ
mmetsp:Transcript_1923/g.5069  ORF Transcript_1923/g.5069 Transcript_1923/m.5069 type:complete len:224 (+) Transcript_1923:721-1392(+)